MAESACLRRSFSFSHSSETSHELQQDDPMCALGESISFGRYMSESLAWEKWSTFSHNRYLEEAEKYSKPGSVAKMKAFFEAHYNRFGAKKGAAQQQAEDEHRNEELEVKDAIRDSPSATAETKLANNHSSISDIPGKDTPNVTLPFSVIDDSCGFSTPMKETQDEFSVIEAQVNIDNTQSSVRVQVHQCKDAGPVSSAEVKVNQCIDAPESDITVNTPENKWHVKEAEKGKLNSRSKQKSADLSVKRSLKSNVSKLSSSIARVAIPVRSKTDISNTPNERKSAKCFLEEKKLTTKMVHMPINSDVNITKYTSPASHKTGIGKVFTPLGKIIRDKFASSVTPSKVSMNSVSRLPTTTPQSETKRSKVTLEKSFARSRILDQKFQSPSAGNRITSVQSPTTFSSFSFRTEERAMKRRELLQKRLEKEAEKLQQLDKDKVKLKTDLRKLSQRADLKVNATLDTMPEVTSDKMKTALTTARLPKSRHKQASVIAQSACQIALTPARLPKSRNKQASIIAQSACQPPQKGIGSELGAEKCKPISAQLRTLPTKMKTHENASPNILQG